MATVEGKLYNCDDDLPTTMVFYVTSVSPHPNPPTAATPKAGQTTAGTNRLYAITLGDSNYHCWLPDIGGGKWAERPEFNHVMDVEEPYTWFTWRAPGNAPIPDTDEVVPPRSPENYDVELRVRFRMVNGEEQEPIVYTADLEEEQAGE